MALYEHVLLARQDVSSQQVEALIEQYKGVIEANGGKVGRIEHWGLKSLTYRINKNRKAHYALMDIDAPSDAVKERKRQCAFHGKTFFRYHDRFRPTPMKIGPSAMLAEGDRRMTPARRP